MGNLRITKISLVAYGGQGDFLEQAANKRMIFRVDALIFLAG
jgi:hypothetical protein